MNRFKRYHMYQNVAGDPERDTKHHIAIAWHPLGKLIRYWQEYANHQHRNGEEMPDDIRLVWKVIGAKLSQLVKLDTEHGADVDTLLRTIQETMDDA